VGEPPTGSTAKTGRRTHRLLLAFDGQATSEYMAKLADTMFSDNQWAHMFRKDQVLQLRIFQLGIRARATCYQLLVVRRRTWPYRLFSGLRDDAVFGELAAAPDCVLDPYTVSFKAYYSDCMGSERSKQELQIVASMADTDTASTERLHSENQRRAKHKVWTHAPDLGSMSAWYVARCSHRQAMDLDRHSGDPAAGQRKRKSRRRPREPAGEEPAKKKRRGGGGAWRAFLHVAGQGHAFTKANMETLTNEYHAVSAEERFPDLGRVGHASSSKQTTRFWPTTPTPWASVCATSIASGA